MTITKDNGIIFSVDGKTQYVSRTELEGLVKAKCANYERDNIDTDEVIERVVEKIRKRSEIGIKKYNTTLSENTAQNYLNHLQEELMDAVNYIETKLKQNEDITQLCKLYPNDGELGNIIRAKYQLR